MHWESLTQAERKESQTNAPSTDHFESLRFAEGQVLRYGLTVQCHRHFSQLREGKVHERLVVVASADRREGQPGREKPALSNYSCTEKYVRNLSSRLASTERHVP